VRLEKQIFFSCLKSFSLQHVTSVRSGPHVPADKRYLVGEDTYQFSTGDTHNKTSYDSFWMAETTGLICRLGLSLLRIDRN
jgi:hypothetical protein